MSTKKPQLKIHKARPMNLILSDEMDAEMQSLADAEGRPRVNMVRALLSEALSARQSKKVRT